MARTSDLAEEVLWPAEKNPSLLSEHDRFPSLQANLSIRTTEEESGGFQLESPPSNPRRKRWRGLLLLKNLDKSVEVPKPTRFICKKLRELKNFPTKCRVDDSQSVRTTREQVDGAQLLKKQKAIVLDRPSAALAALEIYSSDDDDNDDGGGGGDDCGASCCFGGRDEPESLKIRSIRPKPLARRISSLTTNDVDLLPPGEQNYRWSCFQDHIMIPILGVHDIDDVSSVDDEMLFVGPRNQHPVDVAFIPQSITREISGITNIESPMGRSQFLPPQPTAGLCPGQNKSNAQKGRRVATGNVKTRETVITVAKDFPKIVSKLAPSSLSYFSAGAATGRPLQIVRATTEPSPVSMASQTERPMSLDRGRTTGSTTV